MAPSIYFRFRVACAATLFWVKKKISSGGLNSQVYIVAYFDTMYSTILYVLKHKHARAHTNTVKMCKNTKKNLECDPRIEN